MFVCEQCHKGLACVYGSHFSMGHQSLGKCETCGARRACVDCHSPVKQSQKTPAVITKPGRATNKQCADCGAAFSSHSRSLQPRCPTCVEIRAGSHERKEVEEDVQIGGTDREYLVTITVVVPELHLDEPPRHDLSKEEYRKHFLAVLSEALKRGRTGGLHSLIVEINSCDAIEVWDPTDLAKKGLIQTLRELS